MEKKYFIALALFTLFSLFGEVLSENSCDDDWEPYSDEKCLKIFDTAGLISYAEAENFCQGEYNATLVSIGFEDKQRFLETFLRSQGIVDYVWIGLKYNGNSNYVWSDDSDFIYSNWAPGSPKNDPNYCVQIETDDTSFGQWADVLCTKKNLVLCEKVQPWSLSQLQNELMNLKKNLIPVGFIYAQLPDQDEPTKIWPSVSWEDVSSDYAGLFFRVLGGNASSFGSIQDEDSPRVIRMTRADYLPTTGTYDEVTVAANGRESEPLDAQESEYRDSGFTITVSTGEVRPINTAIKIWKRTK